MLPAGGAGEVYWRQGADALSLSSSPPTGSTGWDFHLQNVRTGETVKLPAERALVGTADYAAVRTAGGPYLAALAVRYPAGWALFGLSDDPTVTFNREPLGPAQRAVPKRGDLLVIGDDRFTFLAPGGAAELPDEDIRPPDCFAYITNPDGMEECRAVDHDLLFGRLPFCHVQLADARLSRLSALLASHGGAWYVHALSKKPLGRNRKPVAALARVADGDELLIGPLVVRIEIRPSTAERAALPRAPRRLAHLPAARLVRDRHPRRRPTTYPRPARTCSPCTPAGSSWSSG